MTFSPLARSYSSAPQLGVYAKPKLVRSIQPCFFIFISKSNYYTFLMMFLPGALGWIEDELLAILRGERKNKSCHDEKMLAEGQFSYRFKSWLIACEGVSICPRRSLEREHLIKHLIKTKCQNQSKHFCGWKKKGNTERKGGKKKEGWQINTTKYGSYLIQQATYMSAGGMMTWKM